MFISAHECGLTTKAYVPESHVLKSHEALLSRMRIGSKRARSVQQLFAVGAQASRSRVCLQKIFSGQAIGRHP